ncbi:MAG: excinuclease ABC subunit UvrC [Pseudomonadota bacterium]|nr:excinuclease ABC subunit UvrC [Pseudomonadota bacterium]
MSEATDSGFDGKAYARALTAAPGVYRMYAEDGSLLYVGKAASLKKRVASYFSKALPTRTANMVAQIARMEITVTRTPAEALLLENQLIKAQKPRYNVLLRDDKSYPYVLITREEWPRIAAQRGARSQPGRYFGPYPSAGAVRETLNLMQKLFQLRNCEDSVFKNRSRPCLQYQIGRCSAPCVGLIESGEYAESVRRAALFLDGRSDELTRELSEAMDAASRDLRFEQAARYRDLLASIRTVQARQFVDGNAVELDVLACALEAGRACVVLLSFRDGRNLGTRSYFPKLNGADNAEEVLAAFVSQYYGEQPAPREIVLDRPIADIDMLEEALSGAGGRRVQIKHNVRSERAGYLELVRRNAAIALASELSSRAAQTARLDDLQTMLNLSAPPARIECFDISHTMGEATVASCVVFDGEGPLRAQYRRYNISGIEPGDDYAAMQQALERRFRRAVEDEGVLPDLLLIDGGGGQLARARQVLADLGIDGVALVGVAKGVERKAGHETLILADGRELAPGVQSPGLQLIQQVRDEAHRFAITGHRGRRQKARSHSRVEDIPGIGPRRRAALLKHFGGLSGLKAAGIDEIARVDGINAALAERIYTSLHGLGDNAAS